MRRAWIIPAVAVFALAGCGGNDPAPASAPAPAPDQLAPAETAVEATAPAEPTVAALPDPCVLLPQADAEKLAATPLNPAHKVRDTCTYTGPITGPTAQVEIYVGDGAKKYLDIDRQLEHEFTELSGIGDEAHLEDGTVFFFKNGVWVGIRLVRLVDAATTRKPMEAAARAAAGRM